MDSSGYGDYYDEPARDAFLERMEADKTKRDSKKQINELKKTVDDAKTLKRIAAWEKEQMGPTARGGRKPVNQDLTPSQILGDFTNTATSVAPKIVTHNKNKVSGAKPWDAQAWSNRTYLF